MNRDYNYKLSAVSPLALKSPRSPLKDLRFDPMDDQPRKLSAEATEFQPKRGPRPSYGDFQRRTPSRLGDRMGGYEAFRRRMMLERRLLAAEQFDREEFLSRRFEREMNRPAPEDMDRMEGPKPFRKGGDRDPRDRSERVMQQMYEGLLFKKQQDMERQKEAPKKKSQGRGYKSKQKKIIVVHKLLTEWFKSSGYLCVEVDRSHTTTRVHAKTFDALECIIEALEKIRSHPVIEIEQIGFHKSMKNKYQQKGILVYIKCKSSEQVKEIFRIYDQYDGQLKDHAIALPKAEREKLEQARKAEEAAKQAKEAPAPITKASPTVKAEREKSPVELQ